MRVMPESEDVGFTSMRMDRKGKISLILDKRYTSVRMTSHRNLEPQITCELYILG
jgi:hypothetical protein